MSTLTLRDYRILIKFFVSLIVEIKEQNPNVRIVDLCEALEQEIHSLRALNEDYLNFVKGREEDLSDPGEDRDSSDSGRINYSRYSNQAKLMNP